VRLISPLQRLARAAIIAAIALPSTASAQDEADALAAVEKALDAGDAARARQLAQAALEGGDPPRDMRGRLKFAIARSHLAQQNNAAARAALDRAIDLLDDAAEARYERFKLAFMAEDWPVVAEDLAAIARRMPQRALGVDTRAVLRIRDGADAAGASEHAFEMMLALSEIGYEGDGSEEAQTDLLYFDLTRRLLERGRRFEAERAAETIHTVEALAWMMVDRRFANLWPELDARYGTSASALTGRALEHHAERMRASQAHPVAVLDYIRALRRDGEPVAAANIGWRAVEEASAAAGNSGLQPIYRRIAAEVAGALLDAGETEQGLGLLQRLALLDSREDPGVISQRIDYAAMLLRLGRFDEALDIAARADKPFLSPPGRMRLRQISVCAQAMAGDAGAAEDAASALTGSPMVNPRATQTALLCLDRHEAGVRHMLERLNRTDPARSEALLALSPQKLDELQSETLLALHARFDRIRQDPRVVARQQELGRALDYPLRPLSRTAF